MVKENRYISIGWSGTSWTELEHAVMYNLGMSHISSNSFFFSFLSNATRNGFHSSFLPLQAYTLLDSRQGPYQQWKYRRMAYVYSYCSAVLSFACWTFLIYLAREGLLILWLLVVVVIVVVVVMVVSRLHLFYTEVSFKALVDQALNMHKLFVEQ